MTITETQKEIISVLLDGTDEYTENYTRFLESFKNDGFSQGFFSAVQCLEDLIAVGKIGRLAKG